MIQALYLPSADEAQVLRRKRPATRKGHRLTHYFRPAKRLPAPNLVGRPSGYDPRYCREIIEFFNIERCYERKTFRRLRNGEETVTREWVMHRPRFMIDFAMKIDVSLATIARWRNQHPEFREAYSMARALQAAHIMTGGLLGKFNARFSMLYLINEVRWRNQ